MANKYQIMRISSMGLLPFGGLLCVCGILSKGKCFFGGVAVLAAGLALHGTWISQIYTFICMECFLRINIRAKKAVMVFPSGRGRKRIYCPKCRRKTDCKIRRLSLKAHVF